MGEDGDDDLDEILEDEKTLEEQRIEKTEDGTEYELPDDYEWEEDYGLDDAQKEIKDTKKTVEELKEEVTTSEEMGEKKHLANQMAEKHELDTKINTNGHEFHEAYTMLLSSALIASGFLYSGIFISLYLLGIMYVVYDNAEFIPGEKDSFFAKLTSNHPRFYLLGGAVTFALFIGSGYTVPMPEGLVTTFIQAALGI